MTPRITAVITTHNRAELVGRAIHSVLTQTIPPLELVVVDDGSTDRTRSVVERYAARVRYVRQQNAGVAAARNTAVRHAQGDWIAFLDDDDVWKPEFLSRIGGAIDATGGAALLYFADLQRAGNAQTLWEASGFTITEPFAFRSDASDWFMQPLQPMAIQSAVTRRDAYWRVGGHAALSSREDTHYFFLLGLAGPACAVAGIGALLSDDATTASRLTEVDHAKSRRYCDNTIWLYTDVLHRHPGLPRHQRHILRQRLATAYWHRARLDLANRRLPSSLHSAARSIALSPRTMSLRLGKRMLRGRRNPPSPSAA
jgi:glycosyltransferase involved in cell wall biosynthesis